MSSCDKEDDIINPPVITFTVGDQTVNEGDEVSIVFKVTSDADLTEIRMKKDGVDFGDVVTDFTNKTEYSFNEVVDTVASETFEFTVYAKDAENNLVDKDVTVTVTPVSAGSLTEFTVTLGDQNDTDGSFINLNNSDLFTISTCEANDDVIDLVYYWGNTGNASMYSPQGAVDAGITSFGGLGTWGERATTVFKVDNTADYDAATYESVEAVMSGVTDQGVTQLSENDLIFFKLDDGKCGIIKAGTIVPGKDLKEITFSYKIQVPATK